MLFSRFAVLSVSGLHSENLHDLSHTTTSLLIRPFFFHFRSHPHPQSLQIHQRHSHWEWSIGYWFICRPAVYLFGCRLHIDQCLYSTPTLRTSKSMKNSHHYPPLAFCVPDRTEGCSVARCLYYSSAKPMFRIGRSSSLCCRERSHGRVFICTCCISSFGEAV